ncbi:hypothetical protein J5N97_029820 [Dioscorea zingiberensis]|uniref:Myb/SANT-like domain-containing protein n=1 Tax=Dioscorea zingiberensis TaxID=325984 RepID=A0A9D5BWL3_9LILI|nr:hypothetical protein J5N97_029820 [Dioscorea zingiberensis]
MDGGPSSSTGQKRKGTPNRQWSKEMDNVLIPALVEMAKARLIVDKSFKRQAFVEAANIVNRSIPAANMDADNVENRMRTMKLKYQEMKKLLDLSGVDELKMIVLEDETCGTYVESHSKAKELLNTPIPHFNDLQIICGDDHATGEFARTIFYQFGSENTEAEGAGAEMESEPSENNNNNNNNNNEREAARTSTANNAQKRRRASRVSSDGAAVDTMSNKFDRLATSIDNSNKDWKEK